MKLLFLDIETSPIQAYMWGLFNQNISVDQVITPHSILCWAAKWHGAKEIIYESAGGALRGAPFNAMIRKMHTLLSEADAVCHYNGASFDLPRLNTEFLRLGMAPPPPVPSIDLLQVVRHKFGMTSNKLAFVGPALGVGEKVKHAGWALWEGCLKKDQDSWRLMERYNKQDVELLERLYRKVLPWIDQHPNENVFNPRPDGVAVCPNCGGASLQKRGTYKTVTQEYVRYACTRCGRWSRARKAEKPKRAVEVR